MKKIVLLGSSGSIGESTIKVLESFPDKLQLAGIAVQSNYERALEQAEKFDVTRICVTDGAAAEKCRDAAPSGLEILSGESGLEDLAATEDVDIVLCAVVGMAGLKPVLSAVKAGHDVALATKETLVAGGAIVSAACAETGARLLPVDSEHSAIFQCIGDSSSYVERVILTASGGPFAGREDVDFTKVKVDEALNHPRWNMGKKVTIDSATLMNKGLEVMEAKWLFDLELEKIDVVIHPQSIIHSVVEFVDGSMLSQMSVPDMRFAIQYALSWPERWKSDLPKTELASVAPLDFVAPDEDRFPCLGLARSAAETGGTMPAVLNAANEIAVQLFLEDRIPFSGIWETVGKVMTAHKVIASPDLEAIMSADEWAREMAREGC
jgi:1-deoxy-D-xylulose-5-phosphate reductoisomerase